MVCFTCVFHAKERVRFFIERDEDFKLLVPQQKQCMQCGAFTAWASVVACYAGWMRPFSAYPNDPSFRLAVPEALEGFPKEMRWYPSFLS